MTRLLLRGAATASPLFLLLSACGGKQEAAPPPPPEVGVVTLATASATLASDLPGRVSALETSEVRPQINGLIERRLFTEGALVRKGQPLYQIQDAPYRAALAIALGNLASAQASINATRLLAERDHRLLAVKGVSQQEADNADAAARQAAATVQARAADVQAARVNLGFTRIIAPITGRIGRSLITVGALAQTGQASPLATIQGMDDVYVDITQPASDLLDLRAAMQRGKVTRAAPAAAEVELVLPNGQTYPQHGRLEFSEVTVDPSSGSVTVRARFPNGDGTLLPGLYVRARLVEGVSRDSILAPQQGITRNELGETVALVVGRDNRVTQRKVTTERAVGDRWIVTSGLVAGDRLIVEGQLTIKPGELVSPRSPQQVTAARKPAADPSGS